MTYKVRHRGLNQIRVAKMILSQDGASPEVQIELRERFRHEVNSAAKLSHPNIARIEDLSEDGTCFIMEYIEGSNLEELRRTVTLPVELVLEIARQALRALEYLHREGIVHRDISPENLMLTRDADGAPLVKLIDLGIARLLKEEEARFTQKGVFIGKSRYAAPEHLNDLEPLDGRVDVFSLGVVLYELLTGLYPFSQLREPGLQQPPPRGFSITDPHGRIPPDLRAIVLKALEVDRGRRFRNAAEFAAHLTAIQARFPLTARNTSSPPSSDPNLATVFPVAPSETTHASPQRQAALAEETRRSSELEDEWRTMASAAPPFAAGATPLPQVDPDLSVLPSKLQEGAAGTEIRSAPPPVVARSPELFELQEKHTEAGASVENVAWAALAQPASHGDRGTQSPQRRTRESRPVLAVFAALVVLAIAALLLLVWQVRGPFPWREVSRTVAAGSPESTAGHQAEPSPEIRQGDAEGSRDSGSGAGGGTSAEPQETRPEAAPAPSPTTEERPRAERARPPAEEPKREKGGAPPATGSVKSGLDTSPGGSEPWESDTPARPSPRVERDRSTPPGRSGGHERPPAPQRKTRAEDSPAPQQGRPEKKRITVGSEPEFLESQSADRVVQPEASYPEAALGTGTYAEIVVEVWVNEQGSVEDPLIMKSEVMGSAPKSLFEEAALAAAWKARFPPPRERGVAIRSWGRLTYKFGTPPP